MSWSVPPAQLVADSVDELDKYVRGFALEVQRIAVQNCRVDTGRLRASIMVSIGGPDPSLLPPEGVIGASGGAANEGAATRYATQQALGAIGSYELGAEIVIQSNVSYASPREAEDQFLARALDFVVRNY